MKLLIVAHLDDEILWFNTVEFDLIIIVFLGRIDRPDIEKGRYKVLENHPFKDKILCLGYTETNYWRDRSKRELYESQLMSLVNYLTEWKKTNKPNQIFTHNPWGEYGHSDHVLVHKAVMKAFPEINKFGLAKGILSAEGRESEIDPSLTFTGIMDIPQFIRIRDLYLKCGAWTWSLDYYPELKTTYYLMK